jgi:hypothetical protein
MEPRIESIFDDYVQTHIVHKSLKIMLEVGAIIKLWLNGPRPIACQAHVRQP